VYLLTYFGNPNTVCSYTRHLHPEDVDVTEEDLEVITLENILTDAIYNDFGMIVRNTVIFLMEAQSTFPVNIAVRLFLYLAEIYQKYIHAHKLNVYSKTAIRLPAVELYVVYTGDKPVLNIIRLTDLCDGISDVEVCVHVWKGTEQSSIINQYVQFCHIADEQRKQYGYTKQAVKETIRLCLQEDVLSSFLQLRQEEVADIMVTLFDQEKVWEIYEYNMVKEATEKGLKQGLEQGVKQGIAQGVEQGIAQRGSAKHWQDDYFAKEVFN